MKARATRLLLLAVVLTAALWSPSYSYATLLCPTDFCWDLQYQCNALGPNYVGFTTNTGLTCQDDIGDIYDLYYMDCCRVPGCNPLAWRKYCAG
jgi:hypothetical protein